MVYWKDDNPLTTDPESTLVDPMGAGTPGGSDAMTVTTIPSDWPTSTPFYVTIDYDNGLIERDFLVESVIGNILGGLRGTPAPAHSAGAKVAHLVNVNGMQTWVNELSDARPNIPSSGEKAALVGSSGTPGSGNKYLTAADADVARLAGAQTFSGAKTFSALLTAALGIKLTGVPSAASVVDGLRRAGTNDIRAVAASTDIARWNATEFNVIKHLTISKGMSYGIGATVDTTFWSPGLLDADITSSDLTLNVGASEGAGFTAPGTVQIDAEYIGFTGKSGDTLTGLYRGASSSTAVAHTAGATVTQVFDNHQIIAVSGIKTFFLNVPATTTCWLPQVSGSQAPINGQIFVIACPGIGASIATPLIIKADDQPGTELCRINVTNGSVTLMFDSGSLSYIVLSVTGARELGATSPAYTPTNVTTDRSYDANATTIDELADTLGTLIADLKANGVIG